MKLISLDSANMLNTVRNTLLRLQARTADQLHLAVIGAAIACVDQAQNVQPRMCCKIISAIEECLAEIDDLSQYLTIRRNLLFVVGSETITILNAR
ncbi:hypothetical protein [Nevskia ramosa]|uniref:hypothetical protein n=1 Tax=Nevskia ramosa TaxID=64002 RepID=UPI002355F0EA|nr:hypothetical protein [Nevskia ramosa]